MLISEIRIYAEVLEQGLDFRSYIEQTGYKGRIINCYTKKKRGEFSPTDSVIDRIRKVKDVDILVSAISNDKEYPLLIVEYSTAVPTDDHKMQRADVYYWSAIFKVPNMKISPTNKGMGQNFGGGSRITDEQEQRLAFERKALFYPIKWNTDEYQDVLPTKQNTLSCIPYQECIENTIHLIIKTFCEETSFDSFYKSLMESYKDTYHKILKETSMSDIKTNIVNSTRFHWHGDKLQVKINRFGHAMDPDRGILYYTNMLVGATNTITEIQVNRADGPTRGGYNTLFDALSRKNELLNYVTEIINHNNNVFTDENALHIFTYGLNIEQSIEFVRVNEHEYKIEDEILKKFLLTHQSIVAKTIFFLSTELRLTDKNRNIICTIKWSEKPIREYLNHLHTNNYRTTKISPLSMGDAKEDIITFASVELYKRMQCELLAVSYPGAQGDRCILTGSGRKVLRTYVDIIAYKNNENEIQVFLEECKEHFSNSQDDVNKLNNIINSDNTKEGLKLLFKKTIKKNNLKNIYTSVAAKEVQMLPCFLVDYIFMFNLSHDYNYTYIDYSIAIINTTLIKTFGALANEQGRLIGRLQYDRIFVID